MLDIKLLREKPDFVRQRLATRGAGEERKIDEQKKQMTIVTRDGNRVLIDIPTGKILEKKKAE